MKSILFFCIILFPICFVSAQPNIVKNGKFRELTYDCTAGLKNIDSMCATPLYWQAIAGQIVEIWDNSIINSNYRKYYKHDTAFSTQSLINMPDAAMVCIFTGMANKNIHFSREYIIGTLAYPLQAKKKYKVSFYYCPTDYYCSGLKEFGFQLNTEFPNISDLRPRITTENVTNFEIPKPINQWHKLDTIITAEGGEKFITFGVFSAEKNIKITNCSKIRENGAYAEKIQVEAITLADISLTALDTSEWPLAEAKANKAIVGASTENPAPQVFNKKYNLVFMSNSADLPSNMGEIEAAAQKLRRENVAFTLHIDSPKNYTNYPKTLVEARQNKLTAFFNSLEATNIKYSSPLKMLLQRSQEINIRIEYSHDANLLRDY